MGENSKFNYIKFCLIYFILIFLFLFLLYFWTGLMKDIEFPSLLIGLAGLSFMLSMIATFIQKWVYEKGVKNKSIQNGSRQKNNYFEREKIEKMKNKKLILVIILLLAIVFYWFAYRPSSIKRNCMEAAKRGSHQDLVKEFGAAKDTSGFYTNCLHINGL